MRAALTVRFSSWLAIVRANFGWIQNTAAIAFSLAGSAENQGLETEPDSPGVPRLIRRTRKLAGFFAPVVRRKTTKRISPIRERNAARRDTVAPMRASFRSCSEGGFHSAGATGSTRTTPA